MTTTSELLLRYDRDSARSRQDEFGMSEVGGCRRKAGYRLAHTPPSDAGGSVQAAMGKAIHDAIDATLTKLAGAGGTQGIELTREVRFAGLLGHFDRYEKPRVVDTKSTSSRWLEHLMLVGPDLHDVWQVHLYGAALIKEGYEVTEVQIDYIARDTGDEWTWVGLFEPRHVRDALIWLKNVRETDLEMLPRDYLPSSKMCHSCKFASLCWPYGLEGRGAAKVLVSQVGGVDKAAQELWEARQAKKAAEAKEKVARAALEDARPLEGIGTVDAGEHRLAFRANGLFFVARESSGRQPAVGYEEGPP